MELAESGVNKPANLGLLYFFTQAIYRRGVKPTNFSDARESPAVTTPEPATHRPGFCW